MKTVRAAAKWLDDVGLAALLPGADLVLPSLWEAITGTRAVEWGVQRDDGKFEFTPAMARCWQWKDELPAKHLALAGKHFGRWAALVAPRLIPHAWTVAADRREALAGLHVDLADAVQPLRGAADGLHPARPRTPSTTGSAYCTANRA